MSIHFVVLMLVVSLVIGAIIIFYFYQTSKAHKNPFINTLFYHLIFLNLIALSQLVIIYVNVNIFYFHSETQVILFLLIRSLIFGGLAYTFFSLANLLNERKPISLNNRIFFISMLVISGAHVGGILNYYYTDKYIHICRDVGLSVLFLLSIIVMSIFLYYRNMAMENLNKKKAINLYSLLLIIGYCLYLTFLIFYKINHLVLSVIIIYLNVITYYWFNKYYITYFMIPLSSNNFELISLMQEEYGLSNREKEILALIIEGKSNKQIEGIVFLSPSTVRNHVWIIYKKIGIKSRGQLMNLVLKMKDSESRKHK